MNEKPKLETLTNYSVNQFYLIDSSKEISSLNFLTSQVKKTGLSKDNFELIRLVDSIRSRHKLDELESRYARSSNISQMSKTNRFQLREEYNPIGMLRKTSINNTLSRNQTERVKNYHSFQTMDELILNLKKKQSL